MYAHRLAVSVLLLVCGSLVCHAQSSNEISISNKSTTLTFDAKTGAWIKLVDRKTGDNLLTEPRDLGFAPSAKPHGVDIQSVNQAITDGKAISLEGEWQYAPDTGKADDAIQYMKGDLAAGEWASTGVPSQLGTGDNRLHNRSGEFWYRKEFTCPAALPAGDLMLLVGAIDDTDSTYLNGVRVGRTGQETPYWWETPRYYKIPARLIHRDRPNILLIKVFNGGFDGGIWGPVVLGDPASMSIPEPTSSPLRSHIITRTADTSVLRMGIRQGAFDYEMEYTLPDRKSWFTRRMTVTNTSSAPQTLLGVDCTIPSVSVGPKQRLIFPGSIPVGDNIAAEMQDGDTLNTKGMDPLAVLWDPAKQRGIGTWYHSEDEWSPVFAKRTGGGISLRHNQQIVTELKPGESVKLGTQYIWLSRGSRDAALRDVQQIYKLIGLRAPDRRLSDLGSRVIYCGHPGGTPELNYRYYGGFNKLRSYVPTLRKMGISMLWLLPIWEHGDGTVWNLYSPFDHFKVSPIYGTPEELKQLSSSCTESGIGLMFDMVPHGPPDITPLAKEHPEWASKDREGKTAYEWSQLAFDYANPEWQDYMRRAAEWNAKEYGAIGARVDCGAGGPANWDPKSGHRPSQSGLMGGMVMDKAIRDGFLKANKQVVMMPEEYTSANVFNRVSDMTYDAQLFFLIMDLKARNAKPEEWAATLQTFLHDQAITLPPGSLKMRFISNHDTVSWTFQARRPAIVYGVDHMRARLAMCALIDGVPMLYQGDEDPTIYGGSGVSSVDFLANIYQLRKGMPAVGKGKADYTSIKASGGVFACLRQTSGQKVIVLISLNSSSAKSVVTLSGSLAGMWTDRLSNEKVSVKSGAEIAMAPYQVRVLEQDQ